MVALLAFFDFRKGLPVFAANSFYWYNEAKYANITLGYEVSCKVSGAITIFSGFGNLLSIILIMLERYFYIVWPLKYQYILTNKRLLIISVSCLIFDAVISITAIYGSSVKNPCAF